jgi:hypothetical protein
LGCGANQSSKSGYARCRSLTNADLYTAAELFSREGLELFDNPLRKIANFGTLYIVGSMDKIKFVTDFDLDIKEPHQRT